MTSLGAFFRLTARPVVMWYFLVSLVLWWAAPTIVSTGFPELDADHVIVNAFVFPALMGLIGGQLLNELQHSTFTWTLPGVARRTLGGFVAAGAILGLAMVAVLATGGRHPLVVFAVALSGYCLGSLFDEPLSAAVPLVTVPAALLVLFFSRAVGELADTRPGAVVATAGEERRSSSSESAVARTILLLLISFAVCFLVLGPGILLPSPVELAVVTVLVVAGQAIFRQWVLRHFATADLA